MWEKLYHWDWRIEAELIDEFSNYFSFKYFILFLSPFLSLHNDFCSVSSSVGGKLTS